MKIIKNNAKKETTAKVTCMFCTSILEVTPDDLTKLNHAFPPKFEKPGYSFYCPCCEQSSFVADNNSLTSDFIKKVKTPSYS